jgi:hypothetical protein
MSKMDLLYKVMNTLITVSLEPPAAVEDGGQPVDGSKVDSPKDLLWRTRFAAVLRQAAATKILVQVSYPKRLSKGLTIPACDGSETLANAKKVFKGCIDRNFENWGTNKPGVATGEVLVDAHRMSNGSSYSGIFGAFGPDMDKLCFTQHQIQAFCKKYNKWMSTESLSTFFLFKVDQQFFVASVHAYSGGWDISVSRFEHYGILRTYTHRAVIPQLTH